MVLEDAANRSSANIEKIESYWTQGESTVKVVITASSAQGAEDAANALLDAYGSVDEGQRDERSATLTTELDGEIASINTALATNLDDLNVAATPAETARLQSERQSLLDRRTDLQQQRVAARLAANTPTAAVTVAAGPEAGQSRISLLVRYVPAGMVLGLVGSMIAVAWVARRRPWITSPEIAGRVMGAPVLAVGDANRSQDGEEGRDEVAPVLAMLTLRSTAEAASGIALLVPCGPREVDRGAFSVAQDMRSVLERAGAKVAVLHVAPSGRTALVGPLGAEEHFDGLWTEFSGRDHFEATLGQMGVDADLLVLVPDSGVEHEVLLDLMLLADVAVVATRTGSALDPLLALRRDFDAIGQEPRGVVTDLVTR